MFSKVFKYIPNIVYNTKQSLKRVFLISIVNHHNAYIPNRYSYNMEQTQITDWRKLNREERGKLIF